MGGWKVYLFWVNSPKPNHCLYFCKLYTSTNILYIIIMYESSNNVPTIFLIIWLFLDILGLNSGVMLMNLTRMREFDWISRLAPVLEKYRLYLTWGDQDIINVIFHDHPGKFVLKTICLYKNSIFTSCFRQGLRVPVSI